MNISIRIAATVIIYNCDESILKNIKTYYSQVEKVYVIDNSEIEQTYLVSLLKKFTKIHYVYHNGNRGVAAALNTAAALALDEGFDYLLTMDDDSQTPPNMVCDMLYYLKQSSEKNNIGIVSAVHSSPKHLIPHRAVPYTMTSGNLLNLNIYKQLGPFREDFFIDHVDHEYGLRLNQAGFQVVELPGLMLQHQLGERKASGWGTYRYVSHAPLRGYYIIRNGFVVAKIYPRFRQQALILAGKEWLKALLVEDHKAQRLRLLWRGLRDGWRGRLGKFNG